jgi:hypothetical protein
MSNPGNNHSDALLRAVLRRAVGTVSLFLVAIAATPDAAAQGCVVSPNNPLACRFHGHDTAAVEHHRWTASVSYRWYESARHFGGRTRAGTWLPGDEENTDRERYNQQMINRVHAFDLSAAYNFSPRWSATLTLPFISAERSSLFEHSDGRRHTMRSGGLGDLRVTTDYWLRDPQRPHSGNLALGVGFKAPTGDDNASDTSFRGTGPVNRPVDQSIQPGDGGWGLIIKLEAFQRIYEQLSAYAQGSYLFSPQEHNDTETVMGDVMPRGPMTYNSISDQYFGRAGVSYLVWPRYALNVALGGRIEGVPVYDVIGDSLGYRQPGYTVSVEPSIAWTGKRNSLALAIPVAVYRNRERSAAEDALNRPGGDASFADYSILASFSHRF